MIGVYDSGLGGLTVLAALRRAGVRDDVVYFADQAHVPYGERSDDELSELLATNLAWLRERGAELVVMGCNTSCAVAARRGWPAITAELPVTDLIVNAARTFSGGHFARIAVFATAATVRSGAYGNAIRAVAPHAEVIEIAAPALVPLVEAGATETLEARAAVDALVAATPPGIDALVYGCTHYPMLDRWFAGAFPDAARIDPADAQARAVVPLARAGNGTTTYVTNGDVVAFERNVRRWTGDRRGPVTALIPLSP